VSEKARNYADFMRICQIGFDRIYLGGALGRVMLKRIKNQTKTDSYNELSADRIA